MKLWNYTSSYAVAHSILSLETTGHNSQLTAHTCYMKVNAKGTSLNKKIMNKKMVLHVPCILTLITVPYKMATLKFNGIESRSEPEIFSG